AADRLALLLLALLGQGRRSHRAGGRREARGGGGPGPRPRRRGPARAGAPGGGEGARHVPLPAPEPREPALGAGRAGGAGPARDRLAHGEARRDALLEREAERERELVLRLAPERLAHDEDELPGLLGERDHRPRRRELDRYERLRAGGRRRKLADRRRR